MRILFTSWPAWGHLFPMYPLARAAQQAGREVVFATGGDVAAGLRRDGFTVWPVGPTRAQAVAARRSTAAPAGERSWEQRVAADLREMFAPAGVRQAEQVLPLARDWRPDLVVHAAGDASGAAVAALLGVPSVMHGLSLVPPGFEALVEPLLAAAGERFRLPDLTTRVLGGTLIDLTPASLLPPASAQAANRQPLRPSAGEVDPGREAAELIAALPLARTVYLTLGTIVNNAPGVMEAALAGILGCDVNAVVTTGPGFDRSRLGDLPAQVLVREHIGQATVFPHCSAVVSHAGAGTMLGAASFGLPQLALPMGADQPFNATTLERVGAGLRIDPADLTADAVQGAVGRLLDDASFSTAAQRLRAEIADMPAAPEVMETLETRLAVAS